MELGPFTTEKEAKTNVNNALDEVSHWLGNTRTVCRKHYVHPKVLNAYECRDLNHYIEHRNRYRQTTRHGLDGVETLLLSFLADKTERK